MTPNIFSLYVSNLSSSHFSLSRTTKNRRHRPHNHGLHIAAISQPNRLDLLPHSAAGSRNSTHGNACLFSGSCTSQNAQRPSKVNTLLTRSGCTISLVHQHKRNQSIHKPPPQLCTHRTIVLPFGEMRYGLQIRPLSLGYQIGTKIHNLWHGNMA